MKIRKSEKRTNLSALRALCGYPVRCLSFITALLVISCADYSILESEPTEVVVSIVEVADTTVTLSWTVAEEEYFGSYQVYYSRQPQVDTSDTLADSLSLYYDRSLTVTGLAPLTPYYFRVFVKNQFGRLKGSNIVDTTTLRKHGEVFLFAPEQDTVADTVVHLTWTRYRPDGFRRYWLYADTVEQKVDSGGVPLWRTRIENNTDTTYSFDQLYRGQTFWFRVLVEGYYNDIVSRSEARSITIDSNTVPSPVLFIDSAYGDSARVRWTMARSVLFDHYEIFAAPDTIVERIGTPLATIHAAGDTSVAIGNLGTSERWWIRVFAVAKNGLGSGSNVVANYPVIARLGETTDTTVTIRWTRSLSRNFGGYQVFWDTVETVTENSYPVNTEMITQPATTWAVHENRATTETRFYRVFHYEVLGSVLGDGRGSNVVSVE